MKACTALFLALVLSACASTVRLPDELSPASVRAMIDRHGASATVKALVGDGGEGNDFLSVGNEISYGDQAWLDLVSLLAPGADASANETLTRALSVALPNNATGALRLINADRPIGAVCVSRLSDPSPEDVEVFRQSAIAAVESVTDPALAQTKRDCLASLRRR